MKIKVLHISEAYGGGVVTAVHSFIKNSSEFVDSYILAAVRDGDLVDINSGGGCVKFYKMRRGFLKSILDIRRAINEVKPDYIHVHCAFAGVYVRIQRIPKCKIVYSPHCFPFERSVDNILYRKIFYTIEYFLGLNTDKYAVVSKNEGILAKSMAGDAEVVFLPNVTHEKIKPMKSISHLNEKSVIKICFMGRLAAQKDPGFLLRALKIMPKNCLHKIDFVWIGGGDENIKNNLESFGVRVTGWVGLDSVKRELIDSDFYFHVAAWEGFPMAVLEASNMGLPIALRRIDAFNGFNLPNEIFFNDENDFIETIDSLVNKREFKYFYDASLIIREFFNDERQKNALQKLYSIN